MIAIQLTRKQHRQLRKHFKMVSACFAMGPVGGMEDFRGMLVAQVREEYGGGSAYMHVKWFSREYCPALMEATRPRVPNCWVGVPPHTPFSVAVPGDSL